ncbi:MAG: S8 family serine peptidase [Phycisphaerae bacterium]|nr:MAG: S8 family peptidase [Phycisphaerae bacterium]MBE7457361.1 S8 family peptidase [Planctomycetia bacterium]MCL4720124.1 S8 family serine peptidase [Phycisphaerae bacterium]
MLATWFIPVGALSARAAGFADDTGGSIIDADVQRLMDEKPDEEHALIVSVELCRTPLNLEALLPTPDETNECTRLWLAWERLAAEFEEGCDENLIQEDVDAAYAEAKAYDDFVVSVQQAAYRAYHEDYAEIVAESVPDVYENLRSVLGDRVRRVSDTSKLLAVRADAEAFEAICETASVKRISRDLPFESMLDKSHLNIEADRVHSGDGGVGPYTGDGVRIAIVDTGLAPAHPRLPTIPSSDQADFVDSGGPNSFCTENHGTLVAGVIACQPDTDGRVGIAYDASLLIAKTFAWQTLPCCSSCSTCLTETWSIDVEAFQWATDSDRDPAAQIINFSRGGHLVEADDTDALHVTALNVDWLINTKNVTFVHSCGNSTTASIFPPSGAYNLLSVGGYNDLNEDSDERDNATIYSSTAPGPTDDGRRKPDLCAPGVAVSTTSAFGNINCDGWNYLFLSSDGTSVAAPHVSGTAALLLEAKSSLSPRQIHAILVNNATFMNTLNQDDWHEQAGWGMLHAFDSVKRRNHTFDGTLTDSNDSEVYYLSEVPADKTCVVTGVWHRAMVDEDTPVMDVAGGKSPANLDLIIEAKPLSGGVWSTVDSTVGSYDGNDGNRESNVRQVRAEQNPENETQLEFRVRVEHNPTNDSPFTGSQGFTLASRHGFEE